MGKNNSAKNKFENKMIKIITLKLETAILIKLAFDKQVFDKNSPSKTENQQNEKSR